MRNPELRQKVIEMHNETVEMVESSKCRLEESKRWKAEVEERIKKKKKKRKEKRERDGWEKTTRN